MNIQHQDRTTKGRTADVPSSAANSSADRAEGSGVDDLDLPPRQRPNAAGSGQHRMGGRRRRRHRRNNDGRSSRRGHRRVDWDDLEDLERHHRNLEQHGADIAARMDRVRDRMNELRAE